MIAILVVVDDDLPVLMSEPSSDVTDIGCWSSSAVLVAAKLGEQSGLAIAKLRDIWGESDNKLPDRMNPSIIHQSIDQSNTSSHLKAALSSLHGESKSLSNNIRDNI
jgi:hypothetical protein